MSAQDPSVKAATSAQTTELDRLTQELAQVRAEFQDFVYTVSHDLRAPLRHINAFAQVIEEDLPDAPTDILGHLATIREAAQLLDAQLAGLTLLSRLGQKTLRLHAVNVSAMAQEVTQELAQRQPTAHVLWQLATDVPLVLADAALLRQVLMHVLDNACKFSRGQAPAQITLTWQLAARGDVSLREPSAKAGHCQIIVRDNGVGFAPEQAEKLFKVFARLHPARDFEGLGLGLVSCRKIIERLGGCICIAGEVNSGCCVTLGLPLTTE